jgi:hypothetical protein
MNSNARATVRSLIVSALILFPAALTRAALPPQIFSFITNKEAQAHALEKQLNLKVSRDVWAYFETAKSERLEAVTNAFERLKKRSSQYEGSRDDPTVGTVAWQPALEVELATEWFAGGDPKYSFAFGNAVIGSIPPGNIYFGGTDSGRGIITALSKSHRDGDPFFTVTQNALADGRYLEYLRAMYGEKIRIPSSEDSQRAFQEYMNDAQARMKKGQLKPGEDVRVVDNRVQVSGQVAVMAINALLVSNIFAANPDREFYLEESFPLDWTYPHLSPHGFIFKLNRQPLATIDDETLSKDREFWRRQQSQTIGDWLTPETSVKDVCAFAQKVFGRKDFSGFKGDRLFVEQARANKMYSKLRSASGGLYYWRANSAKSAEEKKRMVTEADLAFRQAFALCPFSPEAIFRYVQLLASERRFDDAVRLAMTAQLLDPENQQLDKLTEELRRMKQSSER